MAESVDHDVRTHRGLTWEGTALTLEGPFGGMRVPTPVVIERWDGTTAAEERLEYDVVDRDVGRVAYLFPNGGALTVEDRWSAEDDAFVLRRRVLVTAAGEDAFLTEIRFPAGSADGARIFVPGMLYGTEHVNRQALGNPAHRAEGIGVAYLREDRMAAPLVMVRPASGPSIAVLDGRPDGATTEADADDETLLTLVQEGLRVGAFGLLEQDDDGVVAFRMPGSEGEVTYRGRTFPDGQVRAWRRRYHPLRTSLVQEYEVRLHFCRGLDFADDATEAWRWAWRVLRPEVVPHDIAAARAALFEQLDSTVVEGSGGTGIPHFLDSTNGLPAVPAHAGLTHALMGFTGRNTDCAFYFLREADHVDGERAERFRRIGTAMIDSMVRIPSAPPAGEGFDMVTGAVVPSAPHNARNDLVRLRGVSEGAKSVFRAWRYERDRARNHPEWLAWASSLADWLVSHQRPDGAMPREWLEGTDTVVDPSGYSTYNAIPMLIEAYAATGAPSYLSSAIRGGEYLWTSGHQEFVFVGGTVDNPDVVDKEAGTISLEAYLALFEATGDERWLDRARIAARFSETWIFLWNIPMAPGRRAAGRGWKPGVPTVGAQLIATGHSLIDQYMAFDVASFAKLYSYSGDRHDFEVARLLLHNTKTMLALPGRLYDLAGVGWQQEHWSFAPVRGDGLHRGWLPWVTCSHIEGIVQTEIHSAALLSELASLQ